MSTKEALRAQYTALTGRNAPRKMRIEELSAAIAAEEARQQAAAAHAAARAEATAKRAQDRADRLAARGSLKEFIEFHRDLDGDEAIAHRIFRRSAEWIESWTEERDNHIARLMSGSPLQTISWSSDFLVAAARMEVAQQIIDTYDNGPTWQDLLDYMMEQLVRFSAQSVTSRSTSVMSNLTHDLARQAWAELIDFAKRGF